MLGIHVTPGQQHESRAFEVTMRSVVLPRRRFGRVIPTRKDQPRVADFDKTEYRKRNIIERVIGWYKELRRLMTRFEKLAVNYVAFWIIASIFRLI